jgi:hypothetical protein
MNSTLPECARFDRMAGNMSRAVLQPAVLQPAVLQPAALPAVLLTRGSLLFKKQRHAKQSLDCLRPNLRWCVLPN